MPLDLGNDTAWLVPGRSLVAEAVMIPADLVQVAPDRAIEQIVDPLLQHLVGRKADRVLDPLGFQELVGPWHGEDRISPEIDARNLASVSRHHPGERSVPSVGAVNIAGTQRATFQIAELVEHKKRVIAGAFVMAVPDAHLLLAVGRADTRIHIEHNGSGWAASINTVNPLAGKFDKCREV